MSAAVDVVSYYNNLGVYPKILVALHYGFSL
jgi:hypothetical protein